MRWMRSTWGSRLLVISLIASLLPAVCAPAVQVVQYTVYTSYADWLRAQLQLPADDAFEEALETAIGARATTLRGFLKAFVAAYEAGRPGEAAASAFAVPALSNEALVMFLEHHYLQVIGGGIQPRVHLLKAAAKSAMAPDHLLKGLVGTAGTRMPAPGAVRVLRQGLQSPFVIALRVLSAARPLGP